MWRFLSPLSEPNLPAALARAQAEMPPCACDFAALPPEVGLLIFEAASLHTQAALCCLSHVHRREFQPRLVSNLWRELDAQMPLFVAQGDGAKLALASRYLRYLTRPPPTMPCYVCSACGADTDALAECPACARRARAPRPPAALIAVLCAAFLGAAGYLLLTG